MKKKVLVVSIGYPTENNPFEGSFFKEQIDFISQKYECTVIVCHERTRGIFFSPKIEYRELEYTKGIRQIYPNIYVSIFRRIFEYIGAIIRKMKYNETAVGVYRSETYRKYRYNLTKKMIEKLGLKYDLVYCISAQESAFQALLFAEMLDKPLIISEHRPYPHPGWATIDVEKEAFEKAGCFLAISKDKIRQVMLQNIHPKRIVCIGNMVDEDIFTISPISHEKTTFLIVAGNSYFKNYNMFIETMEKLYDRANNDFAIIIAGYGANKGYVGDKTEFERKIKSSKFADKVEMIPEIPRKEIPKLYNRSDAFVMTSIQEGQPMAALEAACCGLPIFSTRCGGVDDYVTEEIGRLVDIIDSDSLAMYLNDYLENSIKFNKHVIRNRVVELYGKEVFLKNISYEFDRLLV